MTATIHDSGYKRLFSNKTIFRQLIETFVEEKPDRQAIKLFINWFSQLAAHGRLDKADFAQIEEQDLTREEVKSMLVKALEREREIVRQEGIDIGKKEGIVERNRQIAQSMVANGFTLPTIAALLALPEPEVERLLAADNELTHAEHASDESG
ncbi:MAG: hypothetical protein R3C14_05970 [Caldilineaceae bacterium]